MADGRMAQCTRTECEHGGIVVVRFLQCGDEEMSTMNVITGKKAYMYICRLTFRKSGSFTKSVGMEHVDAYSIFGTSSPSVEFSEDSVHPISDQPCEVHEYIYICIRQEHLS